MGFVKAKVMIVGSRGSVEGYALVDSGAWYTVVDRSLVDVLGIEFTGLNITLTTFSGHRVLCSEGIVKEIMVEDKRAPFELVAVCTIPSEVKDILRKHGLHTDVVIGIHTLERLGLAIDPATHRLIESPGVLMI